MCVAGDDLFWSFTHISFGLCAFVSQFVNPLYIGNVNSLWYIFAVDILSYFVSYLFTFLMVFIAML